MGSLQLSAFSLKQKPLLTEDNFDERTSLDYNVARHRSFQSARDRVVGQVDKEASQTRDDCVARNATLRAARPDPSRRKSGLLRMTIAQNKMRGD